MSAIRLPSLLKTSTFSNKDCENTFYMSAIYSIANANIIFISLTNNTHKGHCLEIYNFNIVLKTILYQFKILLGLDTTITMYQVITKSYVATLNLLSNLNMLLV